MEALTKFILTIGLSQSIGLRLLQLYGKGRRTMKNISEYEHKELIDILEELLLTIKAMRMNNNDYILAQNEQDAKDWMNYLREHTDKEELRSLENEISDRLFYKYDVEVERSELDNKRVALIREYIYKSNRILKL